MDCSRCGKLTDISLASTALCDRCVAEDADLYYSVDYFAVIEARLARARQEYQALLDRGIGSDKRANPTKGRGRLHQAQDAVKALEGSQGLIRSVLVSRGLLEPTLEDHLERAFPDAKHNQVVEWNGQRYRHKWIHDGYGSGGQNVWSRRWELTT